MLRNKLSLISFFTLRAVKKKNVGTSQVVNFRPKPHQAVKEEQIIALSKHFDKVSGLDLTKGIKIAFFFLVVPFTFFTAKRSWFQYVENKYERFLAFGVTSLGCISSLLVIKLLKKRSDASLGRVCDESARRKGMSFLYLNTDDAILSLCLALPLLWE